MVSWMLALRVKSIAVKYEKNYFYVSQVTSRVSLFTPLASSISIHITNHHIQNLFSKLEMSAR